MLLWPQDSLRVRLGHWWAPWSLNLWSNSKDPISHSWTQTSKAKSRSVANLCFMIHSKRFNVVLVYTLCCCNHKSVVRVPIKTKRKAPISREMTEKCKMLPVSCTLKSSHPPKQLHNCFWSCFNKCSKHVQTAQYLLYIVLHKHFQFSSSSAVT